MVDYCEEDKKLPNNEYHCCFCGKHESDWGNNPYPLVEDGDWDSRCCADCNSSRVIPARIAMHCGYSREYVMNLYGRKSW